MRNKANAHVLDMLNAGFEFILNAIISLILSIILLPLDAMLARYML